MITAPQYYLTKAGKITTALPVWDAYEVDGGANKYISSSDPITKSVSEITAIIEAQKRPMRYGTRDRNLKPPSRLEVQAFAFVKGFMDRHVALMRKWWDILPGESFDATRRRVRESQSKGVAPIDDLTLHRILYEDLGHRDKCGPDCNHQAKAFTPSQLDRIEEDFTGIDPDAPTWSLLMDLAGEETERDMVGNSEDDMDGSAYRVAMGAVIAEIIRIALFKSKQAFKRSGRSGEFQGQRLNEGLDFITDIYANGYGLVTSKITKFFLPIAKEIINRELRAGKSWAQVKWTLNRRIGIGGAWHWERLIRSEMAAAISRVSIAQYKQAGVELVKWSAALNRCPICDRYATENKGFGAGIYRIDSAPLPMINSHPNCRCTLLPIYRA